MVGDGRPRWAVIRLAVALTQGLAKAIWTRPHDPDQRGDALIVPHPDSGVITPGNRARPRSETLLPYRHPPNRTAA